MVNFWVERTLSFGALEGLKHFIESINLIENPEQILLLRMLPAELNSLVFNRPLSPDDKATLNEYLEFVRMVIYGGDVGVSFWDKSIYGRLTGGSYANRLNFETWKFVEGVFFASPAPDTTTLGISPNITDWLLVVCTSQNMDEYPSEYICSLRLFSDSSTKLSLGKSLFSTDPSIVKKDADMILELENSLARKNQSWSMVSLSLDDAQKVKYKVNHFLRGT